MRKALTYGTKEQFDILTKDMKECKHYKTLYVSKDGKKIVQLYPEKSLWFDHNTVAWIEKSIKEGVSLNNAGYYLVSTRYNAKLVHRLVADAWFDEDITNKELDHIDGNKYHNSVDNLRIVSHSENMKAAWKNGQIKKSRKNISYYVRKTNVLHLEDGTQIKMSERDYCIWRTQHNLPLKRWMKEYAK